MQLLRNSRCVRLAIVVASCGLPLTEKTDWNAFVQDRSKSLKASMHEHVLSEKIEIRANLPDTLPEQARFLERIVQLAKGKWQLKDQDEAATAAGLPKAEALAKPKPKPKAQSKAGAKRGQRPLPRILELSLWI